MYSRAFEGSAFFKIEGLMKKFWVWFGLLMALVSCRTDVDVIEDPSKMTWDPPNHFPAPAYDFKNNPITRDGFELGRRLFYDKLLSKDSSISCGSCHAQVHAFADHNVNVSIGVEGRVGKRNAPPVFNMAWHPHFNWDGGVTHLEIQPFGPLDNELEMDMNLAELIERLRQHPTYPSLFKKAFGTEEINSQKFFFALTQFQGNIISAGSKYDQYLKNPAVYNEKEKRGLEIFRQHCESCHREPLFTDFSFSNNQLGNYTDEGRYEITQKPEDKHLFKTPSLRNALLTRPYMHDGRIDNLLQVIQHYNSLDSTLAPFRDKRLPSQMNLSFDDIEAMMDFIRTLNDPSLLSNLDYSEPRSF